MTYEKQHFCRRSATKFPKGFSNLFRVISLNANGIRAAARKGFFDWLTTQDADVVCIQETKAQEHQLSDDCFRPDGYHCYYEDAVKKGLWAATIRPTDNSRYSPCIFEVHSCRLV